MAARYDGRNWVKDSRLGPNDATRRLGWQVCFLLLLLKENTIHFGGIKGQASTTLHGLTYDTMDKDGHVKTTTLCC
jgi:hypothetical protein